jgi:RNA-splicing ligase RtcB|uniref:3'-phosphate/5'-hydroxy nucleic acid ligase n=1 Tax=Ackermannviridae sp. TaxID=2831612 RepID=A0A8S5VTR3_9CAUD|nr:MAG TPA: tRNA-splicing ligase RtcB [Ackermannviridae sp.]
MEANIKIFASVIDSKTKVQIDSIVSTEPYSAESVRIMPDVHAGKGCVIGFTSTTSQGKVNPHLVGNDIGCGMTLVKLGKIDINYKDLNDFVDLVAKKGTQSNTPFGGFLYDFMKMSNMTISSLRCGVDQDEFQKITNTLGTLGGGNHFIEIGKSEVGDLYLVIHSGSRRLGNHVYKYYVSKNVEMIKKAKSEKIKEMIVEMKKNGLHTKIEERVKEMRAIGQSTDILDESLLYDYLHDIGVAVEFAILSRMYIAMSIGEHLGIKIESSQIEHCVHNYIDNHGIIRKGACSAYKDQRVVIPINMRDGIIIGRGIGNPDWNYSAPHGAGRVMSRTEAKKKLTLEELRESMEGVQTWSLSEDVIDESPSAYKKLEDILPWLAETVDVEGVLKPVYNYKIAE